MFPNCWKVLLVFGIVITMTLGFPWAAPAQEIIEEEAPVGTEVEPVDEERPIRDEETPPPPEPGPAEEPVVEPRDDSGTIEPAVIGPAEDQSVISPGSDAERPQGLSGWEWVGVVGAGLAAMAGGLVLGALLMRSYDRGHPLTH